MSTTPTARRTAAALALAALTAIPLTACGHSDAMPGMDHSMPPPAAPMSGMNPMPGMAPTSGTDPTSGSDPMPGMDEMPTGDGRAAEAAGFRFTAPDPTLPANAPGTFRFQITGPDGKPVTTFVPDQTKLLHLYLVRSDLTGFQHVHPELAADGTWTARFAPAAPGAYRAYAQFTAKDGSGKETSAVLGVPITVPGNGSAVRLPAPAATTEVDGYTVRVDGELMAGMHHPLTVTVTKDGAPVTDLQPYLDSYAHLTAVHEGDLSFAHLHPTGAVAGDHGGPRLDFAAMVPEPGNWRLFLQFQTAGVLHTAAVTVAAH